jgi:hypothetical protein
VKKIISFFRGNDEITGAILILGMIALFVYYKKRTVENNGIITICKVTGWEPAESGSSLYVNIYLQGKIYPYTFNTSDAVIGHFYFVKAKAADPTDYPIFYNEKKAPACITDTATYYKGWKDFPTCEDH